MVALLHPDTLDITPIRPELRLLDGGLAESVERTRAEQATAARHLDIIGRTAQRLAAHAVGVLALVIVMAVLVLRLAQGTPPASSWEGLELNAQQTSAGTPAVAAVSRSDDGLAPGETVRIIVAGDTLWGIAAELTPGQDLRPVVDLLAERNGGSSLDAGQLLVVPSGLS